MHRPEPNVAVVVDTSLSVGDKQLAISLAEIEGILRAAGQRKGVRVLAVDAAVQTCKRIFSARQVEPVGGGGTDMRVGLERAITLHPKPEVIIVITDGYTPWPENKPKGVEVVVLLHGDGNAPLWAKEVRYDNPKRALQNY